MTQAGYSLADARNYVAIGCVEPTSQGKTLGSTDAAIINLPLALEWHSTREGVLMQSIRFSQSIRCKNKAGI